MMTFEWEQKRFNEALAEYMTWTKKGMAEVLNQKGLYIARGALYSTPKAKKSQITAFTRKKFRRDYRKGWGLMMGAMINKRAAKKGQKGYTGAAMATAMKQVYNARVRSIAFIKAGWIDAIKTLSPVSGTQVGAPPVDINLGAGAAARRLGSAIAANPESLRVMIENSANAKHDKKDALIRYGNAALERAFRNETASTELYIERKMAELSAKAQPKL